MLIETRTGEEISLHFARMSNDMPRRGYVDEVGTLQGRVALRRVPQPDATIGTFLGTWYGRWHTPGFEIEIARIGPTLEALA